MQFTVYNTLSRKKEPFVPIHKGLVSMYVCGPTVYDYAHIGNARPVVVFDTLYRFLSEFYDVTYVRNITDVDDKIIKAAAENQESISELTTRTAQYYQDDMQALNALSPTHQPKATDHIAEMIDIIAKLINSNNAYAAEQHVLFDTSSDLTYGALSKRNLDDMIAGARVEVAPYKKNPSDFVLWKPSHTDEPGWESPWGRGRPGWHIECSAMSHTHLGDSFDIHGGGLDLIFPHHENEIAQSTCAFGKDTFAKTWMHNGMLMVEGKKMSKSLGNFFTVHDLLKDMSGDVIRLVLLSTHYRQPLDWTQDGVAQAKATLDKFYTALEPIFEKAVSILKITPANSDFLSALSDDLNTPLALSKLHEMCSHLSASSSAEDAAEFIKSANMIGLCFQSPQDWKAQKASQASISKSEIESLLEKRIQAKKNKDYVAADEIRDILLSKGISIKDSPEGTTWDYS